MAQMKNAIMLPISGYRTAGISLCVIFIALSIVALLTISINSYHYYYQYFLIIHHAIIVTSVSILTSFAI